MNIDKLLVTTDLSEASECAFATARLLAERFGAAITLLVVLDFDPALPPGVLALSPDKERALKREVRQKVEARLAELVQQHFSGLEASAATKEGPGTAEAIAAYAEELGADMIVLSTHGRTGLKRVIIGSVTERVVRLAPCSVLTVRPPPNV